MRQLGLMCKLTQCFLGFISVRRTKEFFFEGGIESSPSLSLDSTLRIIVNIFGDII
jgi:hypothetical protein